MEAQTLSPELCQELLLQINDNLAAAGIITEEMCRMAREKIVKKYGNT